MYFICSVSSQLHQHCMSGASLIHYLQITPILQEIRRHQTWSTLPFNGKWKALSFMGRQDGSKDEHPYIHSRIQLDRGSIRSSPRDGLSTPQRQTKEQCWTVPLCHSLHAHALNLSILDASILTTVQQVSFMMFSLNMVDYPMSFLSLST